MSPSENQRRNLSRMTAILSGNWKATMLAHSLWEFYNHQLYCTVRADDGDPNRHRIDGIRDPETIDTIRICISIRDNERKEEGLVHELLHANLIPLGYPRFWIDEQRGSDEWILAGGITNLADHIVMRPVFLSFGYTDDRFVGSSRSLNHREQRVDADLRKMVERLRTPQGYLDCVSQYLKRSNIKFKPLHLTIPIIAQNLVVRA